MKKNKLLKKLNGYQKAPRERFALLTNNTLSAQEFVVYEVCIAITDWDDGKGHEEIYGKFQATNKQIAEICGWKSDSTIYRIKEKLLKKGLLIEEGEYLRVKDFEQWQLRKQSSAFTKEESANLQSKSSDMQQPPAKMQELSAQKTTYPLVSSKNEFSLSPIRTDEEYLKIWEEMGKPADFPIDDMKFIDNDPQLLAQV